MTVLAGIALNLNFENHVAFFEQSVSKAQHHGVSSAHCRASKLNGSDQILPLALITLMFYWVLCQSMLGNVIFIWSFFILKKTIYLN